MRVRLGFFAVICLTASLLPQPETAAAVRLSDDFRDNSINRTLWQPRASAGVEIAETNQRVEISASSRTDRSLFSAAYEGLCSLDGDFDLSVDYALNVWPRTGELTVFFQAKTFPLGGVAVARSSSSDSDYYWTNVSEPASAAGVTGTLRLTRRGTTAAAFYRAKSAWVELGSESGGAFLGKVRVIFGVQLSQSESAEPVNVSFDNFKASAGSAVCLPSYAAFGDSVAAGYGLGAARGYPNNASAYPGVLGKELGYDVFNAAVSGACAATLASIYTHPDTPADCTEEVLGSLWFVYPKPALVTLTVGANDIQFAECFKALMGGRLGDPAHDPCAKENLDRHLTAFNSNLGRVLWELKRWARTARIVVTTYYNPLPPPTEGDPCILYALYVAKQYPELLLRYSEAKRAMRDFQRLAYTHAQLVMNRLNGVIQSVADAFGVQTVPLEFFGHDLCIGYSRSSSSNEWLFAPNGWVKTDNGRGSVAWRLQPPSVCSDELCPEPAFEGQETNPFKYSYRLRINGAPHPTVRGQKAIAAFVKKALG